MNIVSRLARSESLLTIEPMRRRHVRAALVIEEQCHPKPWTAGVFASEIDLARHGERYYAVARLGANVVGYAGLMFAPDEAHITNIAIDPQQRSRGFGRSLMIHVIDVAIASGCTALTLEVRVSNVAAQSLYRQFGFAPAGIRQRYYENSEDALVMWAHDIDGDDFAERLARIRERGAPQ